MYFTQNKKFSITFSWYINFLKNWRNRTIPNLDKRSTYLRYMYTTLRTVFSNTKYSITDPSTLFYIEKGGAKVKQNTENMEKKINMLV